MLHVNKYKVVLYGKPLKFCLNYIFNLHIATNINPLHLILTLTKLKLMMDQNAVALIPNIQTDA